jgi:sugar transferase (PEP-CTERM system associated)
MFFPHLWSNRKPPRRVLVLGAGPLAASVGEAARQSCSGRKIVIVGYLQDQKSQCLVEPAQILDNAESLTAMVQALGVNEIVVAADLDALGGSLARELRACAICGLMVTQWAVFIERERRKIHVAALDVNWVAANNVFRRCAARAVAKRLFDLTASALLLIAAFPLMIVAALCIAIESGTPVLYFQKRVGQDGRVFTIFKFRSMRLDAEKDGKPRWATVDDNRVTRVGRIIRKLRIDELPQIFNVFSGEMSFIGPRPERPYFVEQLTSTIRHYDARHTVKPGITGWAQVSYRYGASYDDAVEKCQYDLYYVKNQTLLLDILILIATVRIVIMGTGAR